MATERKIEIEAKYRVMSRARPIATSLRRSSALHRRRHAPLVPDRRPLRRCRGLEPRPGRLRRSTAKDFPRRGDRLKARNGGSGSIHRREEIEGPADATAAPADWPASSARDVVIELCGEQPLLEIVTVRQLRRVRSFHSADATAELSVDEVEVVAGGETVDRFEELELEIKDATSLPDAGDRDLRRGSPAQSQSRSKFERAVKAVRARLETLSADEQARWALAPGDLSAARRMARRSPRERRSGPMPRPA